MLTMPASWKQLSLHISLLLVTCRHVNTKTSGPTPEPQEPISPLPTDVRSVVLKGESHTEKLEVLSPVNLTLECTWTGKQHKLPNITGYWRKDGNDIENSVLMVPLENQQYNLKQVFIIDNEEALGSYSCMFGNEAKIEFILSAPHIGDVRDKPIVSYVGDSAVIMCKMEDTKPKPNTWNWYKQNGTEKEQIDISAEPKRYEIKNDERTTKLLVINVTQADSGLYYCGAVYAISTTMSHVELKVITFYEPLKPFVAIVAEVIVLVVAILLYERSQSKRNAAATENVTNADQTNTLTQADEKSPEESSSMRQRKV